MIIGIVLGIIVLLFWIGIKVTGALFTALLWVVIKLPLTLLFILIGLVCCCTILFIPVGICFFKACKKAIRPV